MLTGLDKTAGAAEVDATVLQGRPAAIRAAPGLPRNGGNVKITEMTVGILYSFVAAGSAAGGFRCRNILFRLGYRRGGTSLELAHSMLIK
jgi:hypothetical protein